MAFVDRLEQLDRRVIFAIVALLVLLPLLFPIQLKLSVSGPARNYYQAIEDVPNGSIVVLSGDYDPASAPELVPMTRASVRHLFRKSCRIIALQLWEGGPPLIDAALHDIGDELGKKYGVDYVNLGYKSGREAVMPSFGNSFSRTFPNDYSGTPVSRLPLMSEADNFAQTALFVNISAGYPGTKEWVQQVQGRFNVRMVSGSTAVQAPEIYPYLQAGQVLGLLGGMAGAAEYEKSIDWPGPATAGMAAQSIAHLFIMFLILLGNAIYFSRRFGRDRQGAR